MKLGAYSKTVPRDWALIRNFCLLSSVSIILKKARVAIHLPYQLNQKNKHDSDKTWKKQVIKVTPQGSFLLLVKKHNSKLKGINWKFPVQSFSSVFQFQGRTLLSDFNQYQELLLFDYSFSGLKILLIPQAQPPAFFSQWFQRSSHFLCLPSQFDLAVSIIQLVHFLQELE